MKQKQKKYAVLIGGVVVILILAACVLLTRDGNSAIEYAPNEIVLPDKAYLDSNSIQYYDVMSENNADHDAGIMVFDDAARYAVAHFEEQNHSTLKNAKILVNYKGNRDTKELTYLVEIEQMDDGRITNVRINAKTGQLLSIEQGTDHAL